MLIQVQRVVLNSQLFYTSVKNSQKVYLQYILVKINFVYYFTNWNIY